MAIQTDNTKPEFSELYEKAVEFAEIDVVNTTKSLIDFNKFIKQASYEELKDYIDQKWIDINRTCYYSCKYFTLINFVLNSYDSFIKNASKETTAEEYIAFENKILEILKYIIEVKKAKLSVEIDLAGGSKAKSVSVFAVYTSPKIVSYLINSGARVDEEVNSSLFISNMIIAVLETYNFKTCTNNNEYFNSDGYDELLKQSMIAFPTINNLFSGNSYNYAIKILLNWYNQIHLYTAKFMNQLKDCLVDYDNFDKKYKTLIDEFEINVNSEFFYFLNKFVQLQRKANEVIREKNKNSQKTGFRDKDYTSENSHGQSL